MSDNRNDRRKGAGSARLPIVFCPKCHKKHYGAYPSMDEIINCDCGFRFYVFVDQGLRIMMTPEEALCEPIAQAMRRFVVATGRCQDIDPILMGNADQIPYVDMQEQDLDEELVRVLEDYQLAVYGKSYITRELIDSICQYFDRNMDVILRKQKDRVDVSEVNKPKHVSLPDNSRNTRLLTYNARFRRSQKQDVSATGGIIWNCQKSEVQMTGQ